MIEQREIWWAEFGEPSGSAAGYRRPVLVVQSDPFNRSRLATVLCLPLTGTLRWANAPGNVLLRAAETGLSRDSVANVSQLQSVDRAILDERAGIVSPQSLQRVFAGIDLILGR